MPAPIFTEEMIKNIALDGYWSVEIFWATCPDEDDVYREQPTIERIMKVIGNYSGYTSIAIKFERFKDPANC